MPLSPTAMDNMKSKANLKYEELKLAIDNFKKLSKEYVEILKTIETDILKGYHYPTAEEEGITHDNKTL